MTNTVNVVLSDPPSEGSSLYTVVKDSNNLEVFSGEALVEAGGLIEIDIGESSQAGEDVFVYIDNGNFSSNTFKSAVGRSSVTSPEQWVYRLDGATQYWQLSEEILVPDGGSIELALMYDIGNQSSAEYVLTSEENSDTSLFFTDKEELRTGASGYISTVFVDEIETFSLSYDNAFHNIKCTVSGNLVKVGILGARFNYERNSSGVIKMFRIKDSEGTIVNEIPLTNKSQGAVQLSTVGSVNATIINYTSDGWEAVP